MSEKLDHAIHAVATVASAPAATVPPAAVAAMTFMGHTPQEWLIWLSILWILVQFTALIIDKVMKFRKACQEKK